MIVAHDGYKFDFPLLLAEINRRSGLSTDSLVSSKWHFSDTLVYLRQVKKDGFEPMKGVTKFGLEALYKHFFPSEQYSGINYAHLLYMLTIYISNTAHRALADVEALERLLTETPLQELLTHLPVRTASSLDTSEEPTWSLLPPSQGTWEDHLSVWMILASPMTSCSSLESPQTAQMTSLQR